MLGKRASVSNLFYQFNLEGQIPADHLLRMVTEASTSPLYVASPHVSTAPRGNHPSTRLCSSKWPYSLTCMALRPNDASPLRFVFIWPIAGFWAMTAMSPRRISRSCRECGPGLVPPSTSHS